MSAAAHSAMIVNLIKSSMEGPDIERGFRDAVPGRRRYDAYCGAVEVRDGRSHAWEKADPSFCRGMRQRSHLSIGNDNLDRIVDPMARIPQCGRQISEWERVSVNPGRV